MNAPPQDPRAHAQAAAEQLAQALAGQRIIKPVTAVACAGRVIARVTLYPTSFDDVHLTPCERACLQVLDQEYPNRHSRERVTELVAKAGYHFGDSTVFHALTALADRGLLDARRRSPRGYLFLTWPNIPAA